MNQILVGEIISNGIQTVKIVELWKQKKNELSSSKPTAVPKLPPLNAQQSIKVILVALWCNITI